MAIGTLAAIGMGLGAVGSLAGGAMAAGAAGQQAEETKRTREAAKQAAAPSADELALLDKQLKVTEQGIERQKRLLAAVDPALMEAGRQALSLLQGQEAGVLAPMKAEQARQRRTLESRLREQLGSGYESSSAGIEALSRFDAQAGAQLEQAQQAAIGGLLGQANQTVAGSGAGFEGTRALGIPLQGHQNIANRRLQAILGTPTTDPGAARQAGFGQLVSDTGASLFGLGAKGAATASSQDFIRELFASQSGKGLPTASLTMPALGSSFGEGGGGGYNLGSSTGLPASRSGGSGGGATNADFWPTLGINRVALN